MTPNPKNIGAAPEEPKFRVGDRVRVLPVVRDADEDSDGKRYPGTSPEMLDLIGQEITLEPTDNPKWPLFGAGWYWVPEWLEKVPDAVGVPEPQAKGPSLPEVTQPGEGVELEDGVGAELADYYVRLGTRGERQAWVNALYPEKLRLLAMTLGQRALRRESK